MKGYPLKYEEGYKYQTVEDCILVTPIKNCHCKIPFAELFADGTLLIEKGFAWDGSSGGAADTKSSQRASAGHDAIFRMLRANLLPHDPCFHLANQFYRDQCIEDGMWVWRANLRYRAIERLGDAFAAVQPDKILTAP